jgi:hypothetical protein
MDIFVVNSRPPRTRPSLRAADILLRRRPHFAPPSARSSLRAADILLRRRPHFAPPTAWPSLGTADLLLRLGHFAPDPILLSRGDIAAHGDRCSCASVGLCVLDPLRRGLHFAEVWRIACLAPPSPSGGYRTLAVESLKSWTQLCYRIPSCRLRF